MHSDLEIWIREKKSALNVLTSKKGFLAKTQEIATQDLRGSLVMILILKTFFEVKRHKTKLDIFKSDIKNWSTLASTSSKLVH